MSANLLQLPEVYCHHAFRMCESCVETYDFTAGAYYTANDNELFMIDKTTFLLNPLLQYTVMRPRETDCCEKIKLSLTRSPDVRRNHMVPVSGMLLHIVLIIWGCREN